MRLNSTTKLLQINLLELHLLKFFHERCTQFFSFGGVEKDIEYVWTQAVPTIFSQSLLVRNAIYLFSALTLWPFYDIDESVSLDKISKLLKYDEEVLLGQNGIASGIKSKDISTLVTGTLTQASLFEVTTEYFISTLRENQRAITRHYEGPDVELRAFGGTNEAAELTITSILIFSYMWLHPDGVLPIVIFNDDAQVDFISLSRNIGNIIASSKGALVDTEFGGLYSRLSKYGNTKVPREKYSMTRILFDKLDEYFYNVSNTVEIDLISALEYETLKVAIDALNNCLYQADVCNFPIAMFSWILFVLDQYYSLVKNKHPFAIKILFVYACMNLIFDFAFIRSRSSFTKFAHWYKEHMDPDEFDQKLFHVSLDHDHQFAVDNFSTIRDFDLGSLSDNLANISNRDDYYEWF